MNHFPDKETDQFDQHMKHALRREDPPVGFAERVLSLAAKQEILAPQPSTQKARMSFAPRLFSFVNLRGDGVFVRWAAAGVVAAALIAGGLHYRALQEKAQQEKERAEGEAAKQRLILALRIAGSKLQFAREKVQQIEVQQINDDGPDSQQEKE
jgi:hypothetical protein